MPVAQLLQHEAPPAAPYHVCAAEREPDLIRGHHALAAAAAEGRRPRSPHCGRQSGQRAARRGCTRPSMSTRARLRSRPSKQNSALPRSKPSPSPRAFTSACARAAGARGRRTARTAQWQAVLGANDPSHAAPALPPSPRSARRCRARHTGSPPCGCMSARCSSPGARAARAHLLQAPVPPELVLLLRRRRARIDHVPLSHAISKAVLRLSQVQHCMRRAITCLNCFTAPPTFCIAGQPKLYPVDSLRRTGELLVHRLNMCPDNRAATGGAPRAR